MTKRTFIKVLSANDLGKTGGHQAGIVVPKGDGELLAFLPSLDAGSLNPSAWIECVTAYGQILRLRYVHYNNRLHRPDGTRNEYRLTHLTKFLRESGAKVGDGFELSKDDAAQRYCIRVVEEGGRQTQPDEDGPVRIKLRAGWRRVH